MFLMISIIATGCDIKKKPEMSDKSEPEQSDIEESHSKDELDQQDLTNTITGYDSITIEERVVLLENHLPTISNTESKQIFFRAFPGTFEEFTIIFGYYGEIDEFGLHENIGMLAETASDYIDAFFNKINISKSEFIKKVIDITKNSEWQSDGITIFQGNLKSFTQENLELVVQELHKREEDQIKDFWWFYYAGPHPESYQEEFKALQHQVTALDQKVGELFNEAYEELLAESDKHGH